MTKKRPPAKLRRHVREQAQGYCEYCICPEFCATQVHSMEHIIPESLGGLSDEENLALACQGCNGAKAKKTHAIDPVTRRKVALFHPRRDDWHKHFTWSPNQLYLIGLTAKGRATIHELDLNRAGVIYLRRLLLLDHNHPPKHRLSSK